MPEFIADVIDQINYNANFNYDKPDLPNPTYQDDVEACRKWAADRHEHAKKVVNVWYQDTGIETAEEYDHGDHSSPKSLKTIATEEFSQYTTPDMFINIQDNLRSHDRSGFSEDEFYPTANKVFSSRISEQPANAYDYARLKHYHRNPHHLEYYVYHNYHKIGVPDPSTAVTPVEMPLVYIWEMLCDWLSNKELNTGMVDVITGTATYANQHSPQPFFFYWRSKYKYNYQRHVQEVNEGTRNGSTLLVTYEWYTRSAAQPMLPQLVPIHPTTDAILREIVDWWQPKDDRAAPSNLVTTRDVRSNWKEISRRYVSEGSTQDDQR